MRSEKMSLFEVLLESSLLLGSLVNEVLPSPLRKVQTSVLTQDLLLRQTLCLGLNLPLLHFFLHGVPHLVQDLIVGFEVASDLQIEQLLLSSFFDFDALVLICSHALGHVVDRSGDSDLHEEDQ